MRGHSLILLVLLLRNHSFASFLLVGAPSRQRRCLFFGAPPRIRHGCVTISAPLQTIDNTTEYHNHLDWKQHPDLNPTLHFETWMVPSKHVQSVLSDERLHSFLANTTICSGARNKIRLVQSYNQTHQLVLLSDKNYKKDDSVEDLLQSLLISNGPSHSLELDACYFSIPTVLDILGIPPVATYEQAGNTLVLKNLKTHHEPFRETIGQVFFSLTPNVETVLHRVTCDNGKYEYKFLAGINTTQVTVVESGIPLTFDIQTCRRWNSRLATERQHLLKKEFKDGQTIADVSCGVGIMSLLVAIKLPHSTIYAHDDNPSAMEALRTAAKKLGVANRLFMIETTDAYDFLVEMGLEWKTKPHCVIVNESPSLLTALRWWRVPKSKSKEDVIPTLYVYTNVSLTNNRANTLESAIDLVAHVLLPEANEPTPNRRLYLNKLGCDVRARQVLSSKQQQDDVVVCVSFKATAQLLRHMQGDYI